MKKLTLALTKPKLCFLIRSLNRGGSETQFIELVKRIPPEKYEVSVITFYEGGELSAQLSSLKHLRFVPLNKKGRWDLFPLFFRLHREIKNQRPDILHSYLETANVASALLKLFHPKLKIIWGIRSAGIDYRYFDWFAALSWKLQSLLSKLPELIIANSKRGAEYIRSHRFPAAKIVTVPNGIDTERFRPDANSRSKMRAEFHISEGTRLIGLAARLDPLKDHSSFLKAAALLTQHHCDVQFVCIGGGEPQYLAELKRQTTELGLEQKVLWLGNQQDMTSIYNGIDILCSTSITEGFSNVIAEAMSCGTPCVVTDVGDSRLLVGETGGITFPQQTDRIAESLAELLKRLAEDGPRIKAQARERIVQNFSAKTLVHRTLSLMDTLLEGKSVSILDPEIDESLRFSFGKNWSNYLDSLSEAKIQEAIRSLTSKLETNSLQGRSFLDIGSGSGIFSLAARRLGARVRSFDFDKDSVGCTLKLKEKFYPGDDSWVVEQASVLDGAYLSGLPQFDVVYSWGVLHHTGAMWKALDNTAELVRPGGQLFIAIYNDQGSRSVLWKYTKRIYNSLPRFARFVVLLPAAIFLKAPPILRDLLKLDPFRSFKNYSSLRGMSAWHDLVDWVGGYPFEVARPEEVIECLQDKHFILRHLESVGRRLGCNQFVLMRKPI